MTVSPEDAKRIWYHDCTPEEATYWSTRLVPHSIGAFWSVSTTAAWRYIPSTCVLCENDRTLPKAYLEMQLEAARQSGQCMVDTVEECDAGHFPMISRAEWLTDVLRRAGGEKRV